MPSGADERVVLDGPAMVGLVGAVGALSTAGLTSYAIVGGVAVTVRLGRAHRATADVDTVVDETMPPDAVEALLRLEGSVADASVPHRVHVHGTKVEILGVGPLGDGDLDGVPDKNALFVAAHSWALATATPIQVVAATDPPVTAVAPFASPAALVAMKLHAIQDRSPSRGVDKRAGDAWDIFRLLTDLDDDASVRGALRSAPEDLRSLVLPAARRILVDEARRTQGWLRSGDDRMAAINADDLALVGRRLVEGLE